MSLNESNTAFSLLESATKASAVDEVLHLYNNRDLSLEEVTKVFKNINLCEVLRDPLLVNTSRKILDTFKTAIDADVLSHLEIPLEYETKKGSKLNAAEILLLTASKFSLFESNLADINHSLSILASHLDTTPGFTFQAKAEQQSQQNQSFREKLELERNQTKVTSVATAA
jgi:hypothetical protein